MTIMRNPAAASRSKNGIGGLSAYRRVRVQSGLTLIELLVALTLGVLITLAATGALLVSRQGFTAVDSAAQLRENARFSAELIQRVAVQAAYQERFPDKTRSGSIALGQDDDAEPGLAGFDNSWVTLAGLPAGLANGSRPTSTCGAGDTSCLNGSDVLVVSNQGATDGSIINCAGIPVAIVPEDGPDKGRSLSIFHVTRSTDGEPTLSCTYLNGATWTTVELVKGVEGLQVLYGVDAPAAAPNTAPRTSNACMDSVPDRYFTAAQMVTPSALGTKDNWRRVRSVRIGMLFRGDVGSAQVRETFTWNVLGDGVVNAADVGANLLTPADGRLRHRLVFTVHLRNSQGYEACVATPFQPCPQNTACS